MRYTFCEKLMWFALAKPSFRQLEKTQPQWNTPAFRRKAKAIFRDMTARTPNIGILKENPLRICLAGGMVWLSIDKATDGSMAEKAFADMVSGSMDSPLIRAAFKMKKKTAFTLKAQQFRKDTSERTNRLSRDNPFHWNAEVILGRDADEYRINYRQCGLCALGRQEGMLHLVKHMCVLDTMSIDWMGGVLYRSKTLANGADCCDFHICKKDSPWDKEARACGLTFSHIG